MHQALRARDGEGVGRRDFVRNAVVVRRVDVDAKYLAEQRREVLPGFQRVPFPAAVSGTDVEITVRPEVDLAAVVIVVGLLDAQENLRGLAGALGCHDVRALRVCLKAHDDAIAVKRQRRVVHVEVTVLLEPGVEGNRIQALLDEACLHVRAERVDSSSGRGTETIGHSSSISNTTESLERPA